MHFISLRRSNQIYNICKRHNFLLYGIRPARISDGREEPLEKINRRANEMAPVVADPLMTAQMCTVRVQLPFRAQ